MMTVKQFAELRGIPIPTVYTWIKRRQASKNGFKVIKIGSVTMIREMRKPVAAMLLIFILASCGHYGPAKKETGVVIERQYFPDTQQTVSGTVYTSKGIGFSSHHIGAPEKYMVVFKCEHGMVFSVDNPNVYSKVSTGDHVVIDYKEYLNKDEDEVWDMKFIDANKQ